MRLVKMYKSGNVTTIKIYDLNKVKPRNKFIDTDDFCEDCDYKYNCKVRRIVNKQDFVDSLLNRCI